MLDFNSVSEVVPTIETNQTGSSLLKAYTVSKKPPHIREISILASSSDSERVVINLLKSSFTPKNSNSTCNNISASNSKISHFAKSELQSVMDLSRNLSLMRSFINGKISGTLHIEL
ncbi:hypothetical protein AYI68_g7727 [Smittium mucronatum]|uniref:Uncharacterized protein n=1 Tax=Smittium mucronatum TaxID=133383 RepID=A0A1R0GMX4_9FUNG|nr:hypothetical protein AYI68_g7727 [Smittium mucronatum]